MRRIRLALFAGLLFCQLHSLDAPAAAQDPSADPLESVRRVFSKLGLGRLGSLAQTHSSKNHRLYVLRGDGEGVLGYACFALADGSPVLEEVILDACLSEYLETRTRQSAQRAVGTAKTLGESAFFYDGLLSYSMSYPFADSATGAAEGRIGVDVLTGRLSLPGAPSDGILAPPERKMAEDFKLLDVPRFKVHQTQRATTLAMLFAYLADSGSPEFGRKKTANGKQTLAQYIEEFSKACGACSERTATEVFITGRKKMAKIGTYRVSGEKPQPGLVDTILSELDAGRPCYIRLSTANVNHFAVICGWMKVDGRMFLIARLAAGDGASEEAGGYSVFSLPAAFDSAEVVTVEVRR